MDRRKRIHRVGEGGCGGQLRTLYIQGLNPLGIRAMRTVGQVCTGCRQVWLDQILTIG